MPADEPDPSRETSEPHSRLLRCSLCIDESRAYWAHVDPASPRTSSSHAFGASWFGTKSEAWTAELLSNMRVRFDAFPDALRVLAGWRSMPPETRRLICHFHVQLTDPLYRAFTGDFLASRRDAQGPRNLPVVLLYPGERKGDANLSFMGELAPDRDYRPRIYS